MISIYNINIKKNKTNVDKRVKHGHNRRLVPVTRYEWKCGQLSNVECYQTSAWRGQAQN